MRRIFFLIFCFLCNLFIINAEPTTNLNEKNISNGDKFYEKGKFKNAEKTYFKIVNEIESKVFSISDNLTYNFEQDLLVSDKLANKNFNYESVYFYYKGIYEYSIGNKDKAKELLEESIKQYETYFAHIALWACTEDEHELETSVDLACALLRDPAYLEVTYSQTANLIGAVPLSFLKSYQKEPITDNKLKKIIRKSRSNAFLILARLSEDNGDIDRTWNLYSNAVYAFYTGNDINYGYSSIPKDDLEYLKNIDRESIEVAHRMRTKEAIKKGFTSIEEMENYEKRTSPDNLLGYLQVGSFDFLNGLPFKKGDIISLSSQDSMKLNIVDYQRDGDNWILLVGFYMPLEYSKYCYIITNNPSISGSYKLKYIKNATYTTRNYYGIEEVNTYVFQMVK